jgi:hypothetical protein
MEQIPYDDPQDAESADNVLQHLRHSLQMLATRLKLNSAIFPPGGLC